MAVFSNIRVDTNLKAFFQALKNVVFRNPSRFFCRFNLRNIKFFLKYANVKFDCPNCGAHTKPIFSWPDLLLREEHNIGFLREDLACRNCFATVRDRTLFLVFLQHLNNLWKTNYRSIKEASENHVLDISVLNTDNFSKMNKFLQHNNCFWRSSYLPDKINGIELEKGVFNVDLQNMMFNDDMFDVLLTSEVMEHVRHPQKAHQEIFRTLKRGGVYIFTVPYNSGFDKDKLLVDTSTNEDVFLCSPQYHGDSLTSGILVYRIFGNQIFADLEAIGFSVKFQNINSKKHLIVGGDIFCAIKTA